MRRLNVRALAAIGVAALAGMTASSALALPAGPIAGYSAPASGAATQTATVSVKVPKLNCSKIHAGGFQSVLEGVRIEEPSGMTSMNSGGSVLLTCNGPNPEYLPHIQVDGTNIGSGVTIKPGDTVTSTVSVSASAATVTIQDGGQSQTASGAGSSVIAEDIGSIAVNCNESKQCVPVPRVSKAAFKGALINGMSPAAAGATRRDLTDASSKVEMTASELKTKPMTTFSVTWVQSCGVEGVC